MIREPRLLPKSMGAESVLQVYMLGLVEFEAALALQRRLVYQVTGDRNTSALILCEHPPLISVGREGSWSHLHCSPEELRARRWRVRWVNRGGGCLLHLPGQLACYPILPLDRFGLGLQTYVDRLGEVVQSLLGEFDLHGQARRDDAGVWVNGRPIAGIGVAVHDWVSYYGFSFNVNPDLQLFRLVRWGAKDAEAMTSLERERRGRLRPSTVRERLLEHFVARFPFSRTSLFSEHPMLARKARSDALATYS
ncbi:MAG TPA: lipoyl(octanoyl) transferase LipB [Gemmataceae bacterium]|jgi:lipoyl(octanoyl) transferase|nr:lipoyl(octanoyl) transferase LipB [Gemmataceae bacterium]